MNSNAHIILKAFLFWGLFEIGLFALTVIPRGLPNYVIAIAFAGFVSVYAYILSLIFTKNDTLTMADIGLVWEKGSTRNFVVSLVAGMGLISILLGINFMLAPLEATLNPEFTILRGIILSGISFILLSAMEEIAFRGYFLKKLQSVLGIRAAVYITSICFGLYHGLNMESAVGPAIWGLTFAALALWSGNLAAPIAFHAGINYVPAMMGEKLRYAEGIWSISLADETYLPTLQTISYVTTGVMLVVGIVLIELYIRKNEASNNQ